MSSCTLPTKITGDPVTAAEMNNIATSINSKQDALGFTPENAANKGIANGYASLDSAGRLPSSQFPTAVDEVKEYANFAGFPGTGAANVIYLALDTGFAFRWTGSAYLQIVASPGTTDALAEGATNKYFTAARVLATALTGIGVSALTAIIATDTLLQAFAKIKALILLLAGGTAGQSLVKIDGTDFNWHWVTVSGGGGGVMPIALSRPAGTSLPITLASFQTLYSAFGDYPRFEVMIANGAEQGKDITAQADVNKGTVIPPTTINITADDDGTGVTADDILIIIKQ